MIVLSRRQGDGGRVGGGMPQLLDVQRLHDGCLGEAQHPRRFVSLGIGGAQRIQRKQHRVVTVAHRGDEREAVVVRQHRAGLAKGPRQSRAEVRPAHLVGRIAQADQRGTQGAALAAQGAEQLPRLTEPHFTLGQRRCRVETVRQPMFAHLVEPREQLRAQLRGRDRLWQEAVGSRDDGALAGLLAGVRRKENDRKFRELRVGPQPAREIETGRPRQLHVHQQHARSFVLERPEEQRRILEGDGPQSRALADGARKQEDHRVIVQNHYAAARHRRALREPFDDDGQVVRGDVLIHHRHRAERTRGRRRRMPIGGEQHQRHTVRNREAAPEVSGRDHRVRALTQPDASRELGSGHHDEPHVRRRGDLAPLGDAARGRRHTPDLADGDVLGMIGSGAKRRVERVHDATQVRPAVLGVERGINDPRPRALLHFANALTRLHEAVRSGGTAHAMQFAPQRVEHVRVARIHIEQRRALLQPLQRGTRRPEETLTKDVGGRGHQVRNCASGPQPP